MASEPTATVGLRNDFRTELTTRFRALKGALRTTVGYENDALRLRQSGQLFAAADDIEPSRGFPFRTDAEAQDEFLDWLDEQINAGILEPIERDRIRNGEHYTARYVRSAYSRGDDFTESELRHWAARQGIDESEVQAAFNRPVPTEDLEQLYTRAFGELETVTQDMRTAVRRELATGFSEGWNPRKTARRLNDRVDKIGITDAERLARSETMNAHNTAAKSRYSQFDVEQVNVLTFDPCSICAALAAQNPWQLSNAPDLPGDSHPNCVCTLSPHITN